jgi:hypothetical protein
MAYPTWRAIRAAATDKLNVVSDPTLPVIIGPCNLRKKVKLPKLYVTMTTGGANQRLSRRRFSILP